VCSSSVVAVDFVDFVDDFVGDFVDGVVVALMMYCLMDTIVHASQHLYANSFWTRTKNVDLTRVPFFFHFFPLYRNVIFIIIIFINVIIFILSSAKSVAKCNARIVGAQRPCVAASTARLGDDARMARHSAVLSPPAGLVARPAHACAASAANHGEATQAGSVSDVRRHTDAGTQSVVFYFVVDRPDAHCHGARLARHQLSQVVHSECAAAAACAKKFGYECCCQKCQQNGA
jgi:hypothetical protein